MSTNTLEWFTRRSLIESIEVYQQHLSPKKGFACPHRLLHGGQSCSDYIKTLLIQQSLGSALPNAVQRFRGCAAASQQLKASQSQAGCIVVPCCIPL